MTTPPKKNCFIISPIGEEGSDTRKRADQVLKHVVSPALDACGYNPIRADKISEPGLITSQVIQHIIDDPLVVADLTDSNPNVFYELALRHAIRKPLVQIIKKGDKIPFDVAGMRTILVDHTDLDSVDEAKAEIIKQIKAVEGKKPEEIDSPVSLATELQQLRHSDKPEERSFAQLLSLTSELRAELAALDKKVSDPVRLLPPDYLREMMARFGGGGQEVFYVGRELERIAMHLEEAIVESKDPKATKEKTMMMAELRDRLRMLMKETELIRHRRG